MNEKKFVVITILVVIVLMLGIGLLVSLKIGKKTTRDLEYDCLSEIAGKDCNNNLDEQNNTLNWVMEYTDIDAYTYGCIVACHHSGIKVYSFTAEEIDRCNMTKWLETG